MYGKKYLNKLGEGLGKEVNEDLSIYREEEIQEMNEIYEVTKYAEGYLGIGDDGGGNMYILNCKTGDILKTDMGDMNPKNSMYITNLENDWVQDLSDDLEDEDLNMEEGETFRIDITKRYSGGVKGILQIKKEFTELKSGEMLEGIRNPPYTIAKGLSQDEACLRLLRLGEVAEGLEINKD